MARISSGPRLLPAHRAELLKCGERLDLVVTLGDETARAASLPSSAHDWPTLRRSYGIA
jgi:hypothetical protein